MKKRKLKKSRSTFTLLLALIVLAGLLLLELLGGNIQLPQALSANEAQLAALFEESDLSVCIFNIGQADSIVLKQGETTMLIDCGEADDSEQILSKLDKLGVTNIDTLILTHPHADHIGGAVSILENIPIGKLYMPAVSTSTITFDRLMDCILERKIDASPASAGLSIPFGQARVQVLSPPEEFVSDNLNEYSVVLLLEFDGIKMLFAGDAERKNEDMILLSGEDINCDLVKIGHHGSNTSSTRDFINACGASWAVVTTEYNSQHGLPKDEVLTRWENAGAAVLCTHLCGDIYAFTDNGSLTVCTGDDPVSVN